MGDIVQIETGYCPRPLQTQIHREMKRFSVLAIHRRFGKTVLAVNELIDRALTCDLPNPRMGYIAPFYKQAKAIAWDYLKEFTRQIPNAKAYESELRVDIPVREGSVARIQLYGADNPDSLRGLYFDHIVFDEFGLQPVFLWSEVLRPALADRRGGATFLGTPNGKNHFFDIYHHAKERMAANDPEWYAATYRADETMVIHPDELKAAKDNMEEADYRQEFLCDWTAAVKGAFYADKMSRARDEGRIMRVPHETSLPVHCAFDLGLDDATAVWFVQCFRNEIRLIDYEEWTDTGLIDVLKEMRQMPYVYGDFFMPWDIDIRELTTNKTRLETVEGLGFSVEVASKLPVVEGINAVQNILSKCYFDEINCARGIDCLESYRKKWDQRRGEFTSTPEHDEYSHGADSFRTLAVAYDPMYGEKFTTISANRFMQTTASAKVRRST